MRLVFFFFAKHETSWGYQLPPLEDMGQEVYLGTVPYIIQREAVAVGVNTTLQFCTSLLNMENGAELFFPQWHGRMVRVSFFLPYLGCNFHDINIAMYS